MLYSNVGVTSVCLFFNFVATSIYQQRSDVRVGGKRFPRLFQKTTVFQGWIPTICQTLLQRCFTVGLLLGYYLTKSGF